MAGVMNLAAQAYGDSLRQSIFNWDPIGDAQRRRDNALTLQKMNMAVRQFMQEQELNDLEAERRVLANKGAELELEAAPERLAQQARGRELDIQGAEAGLADLPRKRQLENEAAQQAAEELALRQRQEARLARGQAAEADYRGRDLALREAQLAQGKTEFDLTRTDRMERERREAELDMEQTLDAVTDDILLQEESKKPFLNDYERQNRKLQLMEEFRPRFMSTFDRIYGARKEAAAGPSPAQDLSGRGYLSATPSYATPRSGQDDLQAVVSYLQKNASNDGTFMLKGRRVRMATNPDNPNDPYIVPVE